MHKIEEIKKALNLLDTYDGQLSKTAKALGINRYTLSSWRDKRKNGEPLISRKRDKSSKWSKEEQELVIEYYFSNGENISKACRKFGYPSALVKIVLLLSYKKTLFQLAQTNLATNSDSYLFINIFNISNKYRDYLLRMVAQPRVELGTYGFSVRYSTC